MNEELREAIGRAAYEAALGDDMILSWAQLTEEAKEVNRRSAEAAVVAANQWMKRDLEQQLGIRNESADVVSIDEQKGN